MKKNKSIFVCIIIALFLCSLGVRDYTNAEEEKNEKVLNVYNWEDYFGPTTIEDFEKQFGVKVNLTLFDDEEMLLSDLQSTPGKCDVFITSEDSVREQIQMRLVAKLNLKNIPNIKNIYKKFLNPNYDPGNKHSIPYLWGTTGIVINKKFIKERDNSWKVFWNPDYKGKIAMLNNPDEVIGAALKMLGYSINSYESSRLEKAGKKLHKQLPLLVGYLDTITIKKKLISGELWAAQIYSGEGMAAVEENEDLVYFIPEEGAAMWIDCMAISRDSPHKETGELFINYILEPKVSAAIANHLWYANCNEAARPYTDKEILESPELYPPENVLKRCAFYHPSGTSEEERKSLQLHNRIWSELMLLKLEEKENFQPLPKAD